MKTPKLFVLLNLLSEKQVARLKLFVASGYFNSNDTIPPFLEAVLQYRHHLGEKQQGEVKQYTLLPLL